MSSITTSTGFRRAITLAAASAALAAALAAPAAAAPRDDTTGCATVIGLFESGNPGIATAAATGGGYGPCGFGAPPGLE